MDSRAKELLEQAAERLGWHGQNITDLILSDSIYRYLHDREIGPMEARVEQED